jgi:hypothetical protein
MQHVSKKIGRLPLAYVLQYYQAIVQKKNIMINYPKANLADMLHSDSSICILLVLKNMIKYPKANLADVLHSDLCNM